MAAVELVAHRGHAAVRPENTLEALADAVSAGARWVEIDVQMCGDGTPVVLHDTDFVRVAGRPLSVFDIDAAALDGLPVGEPARFGDRFAQVRVPTLAAFASWLGANPGVRAFVELKPESLERFGRERMLEACLESLGPVLPRCVLISFDAEVIALARDRGLDNIGWVTRGFDAGVARLAMALEARWLFCNKRRLPPGPLPVGPWEWVIYEVPDTATALALHGRGARWLETRDWAAVHAGLAAAGLAAG